MVASHNQVTVLLASLGREMARLISFCHWLICCPRVCGRKLDVRMCIHLCMHDSIDGSTWYDVHIN